MSAESKATQSASPEGYGKMKNVTKMRRYMLMGGTVLAAALTALTPAGAQTEAPARGLEIIATPIATPFVHAISEASQLKDVAVTEMNSVPAFEALCEQLATDKDRVVLTAMSLPPGIAESCADNGISELFEAEIGFLTLVLVQKVEDPELNLSAKQIFLALAKDVPTADGFAENEVTKWNEVDRKLPETEIKMIMAPLPGVTRQIFEAEAMIGGCRKFQEIKNIFEAEPRMKVCTTIRPAALLEVDDGAQRLEAIRQADPGAVGLIPIDMYEKNKDWLRVIPFNGVMPTPKDINAEDYNLASPIYVYTDMKKAIQSGADSALNAWMTEALGEAAIGDNGYVDTLGLTPLPSASREWQRKSWMQ